MPAEPEEHIPVTLPLLREERPVEVCPSEKQAEPEPAQLPPEAPAQQTLSMQEVSFRVIGETMDTYILVEQGESLLLIDKHAAHERVLFEKLKSEAHPVMPQLLLQPVPVQLTKPEAQAVLENLPLLQSLGFDVSEFSDWQLVLRQVPADLSPDDACAAHEAFADGPSHRQAPSESTCATICCTPWRARRQSRQAGTPNPKSARRWCARFCPATTSNTARMGVPCALS